VAVTDGARWDRRYADLGAASDEAVGLPDVFADHADEFPTAGFALDIACGQGLIALWLAERGMSVTGYDVSTVAVQYAVAAARRRQVADRCRFEVADLDRGLPASRPADVIACHLFRDARLDRAVVERLAPGGLLAIAVRSEVGATAGRFRSRPGELTDAFAGLDIVDAGEGSGTAWLVGRRPTSC
jgi:SAM-dependent methyltransferase